MNDTRPEYIKRINAVLDYIEKNLDAELRLENLAKQVHYSPFHFHRVFSIVVNERLNEFIVRKRLERIASILLVEPSTILRVVAFKYGFNSANSFSRAFKQYYGISPSKFKAVGKSKLSKIGVGDDSIERYLYSIDNVKQWIEMNAEITLSELQELKLAAISSIGDFHQAGEMFQRLMQWGVKNEALTTSDFKAITIYHDNPNVTSKSKVRFSAAVTIHKNIEAEGDIRQLDIQKGYYAVGHFEIHGEDIAIAWKNMCIWVLENDCKFRDGNYFEIYHNDHQNHRDKKFIVDICIPIEMTKNRGLQKKVKTKIASDKKRKIKSEVSLDYHQLIGYMKELSLSFQKEFDTYYKLGRIYQGSPEFSYFSLTSEKMKKQKLKFVIVFNHKLLSFSICLSGQNKEIRKKYWTVFKDSDWNKYKLAESIDDSLSIIDQIVIENADFTDKEELTRLISSESSKFMDELSKLLDS